MHVYEHKGAFIESNWNATRSLENRNKRDKCHRRVSNVHNVDASSILIFGQHTFLFSPQANSENSEHYHRTRLERQEAGGSTTQSKSVKINRNNSLLLLPPRIEINTFISFPLKMPKSGAN